MQVFIVFLKERGFVLTVFFFFKFFLLIVNGFFFGFVDWVLKPELKFFNRKVLVKLPEKFLRFYEIGLLE